MYRMVRKGFTKVTFEITEESERPSHAIICTVIVSGRGSNRGKGPETQAA